VAWLQTEAGVVGSERPILRITIGDLLLSSGANGRHIAVHLVGATLQLRFPSNDFHGVRVARDAVDDADPPTDRPGDFVIGDTVFHVTVSPSRRHFEKCEQNVLSNLRPLLLVPESQLANVTGALKLQYSTRIGATSIESFISQNMEEMSVFSYGALREQVKRLIEVYNQRIDEAELGKPYLRIDASRL
jgi:hypothetical protein